MSEEKKVVLITGAAMGQGRAHAVKYAQNGFNVVVADMLDVEDASMTIKVTLNPGHSMNYHSHPHRDEVWVVISGTGRTVVDGMTQQVHAGDVSTMQAGCRHTVSADSELQLIEVQLGREISVHDKQKYPLET